MNSRIFDRSTGDLSQAAFASATTTSLLLSLAYAPQHRFDGERTVNVVPAGPTSRVNTSESQVQESSSQSESIWAHRVGVNALAVEKFDGRLLISGGADGAIKLWDLDQAVGPQNSFTFKPVASVTRSLDRETRSGHSHGVTHLDFYPFDPDAFLSSSFDKTLKLWSTARAAVSASFNLNATIYSHATSPIADNLLVACASQHSAVRLVDLRSGSALQALVAHGGAVLSVAWNPRHSNILASGHVDGRVRLWDVRRAGGVLAHLDKEDHLGVLHRFNHAMATGMDWDKIKHFRATAKAHEEGVNGLAWTNDGKYLVSAGLDRRIRVWDAASGANTLASFGSAIQNRQPNSVTMFVPPVGLLRGCNDMLFWPNENEILILDLQEGTILRKLRTPGRATPGPVSSSGGRSGGGLAARNRVTSITWRGCAGDGQLMGPVMGGATSVGAIYSAHLDGQIRAWMPVISGEDEDMQDEATAEATEVEARKRKALDNAYRSLTGRQITFT